MHILEYMVIMISSSPLWSSSSSLLKASSIVRGPTFIPPTVGKSFIVIMVTEVLVFPQEAAIQMLHFPLQEEKVSLVERLAYATIIQDLQKKYLIALSILFISVNFFYLLKNLLVLFNSWRFGFIKYHEFPLILILFCPINVSHLLGVISLLGLRYFITPIMFKNGALEYHDLTIIFCHY